MTDTALTILASPVSDPLVAAALWADDPVMALLDSAAPDDPRSRFSYLAVEPFRVIELVAGRLRIDGVAVVPQPGETPFAVLRREWQRYHLPPAAGPVPFCGGAVGLFGYELGRTLERLPARHGDDPRLPDLCLGLYDVVVAFDRQRRDAWILSSGFPETDPAARAQRAAARAAAIQRRLAQAPPLPSLAPPAGPVPPWRSDRDAAAYRAGVARVLDYIRAGDIFQANFTTAHRRPRTADDRPFALYRRIRAASPAPFAGLVGLGPGQALVGASPERFLRLTAGGMIESRPIKGTRPRGATAAADQRQRQALLASAKDRAENLMIADLLRNDIGRVAVIGSVTVPALAEVESFVSVHHLVSEVRGRLRPGLDALDLLAAAFPGGSVTGAPKIRAMEIIDELEAARRGPYCGAVAWLGFDGAMDSSIVIRSLVVTPDGLIAQAGGGIVADSDPHGEYQEMLTKIGPLLRAVGGAGP